jgi:hypothetical protein
VQANLREMLERGMLEPGDGYSISGVFRAEADGFSVGDERGGVIYFNDPGESFEPCMEDAANTGRITLVGSFQSPNILAAIEAIESPNFIFTDSCMLPEIAGPVLRRMREAAEAYERETPQ